MEYKATHEGFFVNEKPFNVKGVNWHGAEGDHVPHGLWAVTLKSMVDSVVKCGFNMVRMPLSVELMEGLDTLMPKDVINFHVNPELKGKKAAEVLDIIFSEFRKVGVLVVPDVHREMSTGGITPMPITETLSEARFTKAWLTFLERFKHHDVICAADLKNEPHGPCDWKNDWAPLVERVGNAILSKFPRLTIWVAGVEKRDKPFPYGAYWGSVLDCVRERPIRLNMVDKVVYTPHYYGWSVFKMPYHSVPEYPQNILEVMQHDFGYIKDEKLGCVICGEWGGDCQPGKDREYHDVMSTWLAEKKIGAMTWTLGPNSSDTKGALLDDWVSIDTNKKVFYDRACPDPTKLVFGGVVPPKPEPAPVKPIVAPKPPSAPVASGVKLNVTKRESWKQGNDVFTKIELEVVNGTAKTITPTVHASKCVPVNTWSCSPNPPLAQGTHILSLPVWLMGIEPGKTWTFGGIYSHKPGTEPVFKLDGK